MKIKITARKVIWAGLWVLLLLVLRPVSFLIYVYAKDQKTLRKENMGIIQDASNLNQVKVDTIVKVLKDPKEAIIQIRDLIKKAGEQGKSISTAGAQHTMGGHSICKHGIVLNMKTFNYMKVDTIRNLLLVGAGALWAEVIPYLEQYNKSVRVMQSNNSFSVGGSISVNYHGWQANSPPIASTVESFRLINPSGEILNCSRIENSELFSLALGGYGLFGVIMDLQLKITDNKTYISKQYIIKSKDYFSEFKKHLKSGGGFEMAYGRINVNHDHFMEEAILSTYVLKTDMTKKNLSKNTYPAFRRTLFRASVNSDYGKNLRWSIEKMAVGVVNGREFPRNKLFGEGGRSLSKYRSRLYRYFT
ncbi:FAD-binding oxidoreductase [Pedobacter sp. PAMC26386]|nr:FAD-binding oxidoreductase [Pedobacter sp. PAMC26386]